MDHSSALHAAVVGTLSAAREPDITVLVVFSVVGFPSGGMFLVRNDVRCRNAGIEWLFPAVIGIAPIVVSVALAIVSLPFLDGPPPSVLAAFAARDSACAAMLESVSSGSVRWMDASRERDVINACGADRFSAAANAPDSRYAAR